ncbi:extracellular solute-binding protein [Conexibacter woesei]|uniref:Extracellular solute-binding protein family 1 n=1 Tax=Conexibacter woesei (strain DSM 14684 / CCUG 47730 / CIP 108061 / JCM 11494 / NBRC 100937 / ID131577) TaxID=469383 RepID=D3F8D2_CONWI|nr:extracellular solute-binding protein [Conexibacter woesei]ADB49002.1 extracellular solute-binding protein family 1 [Conexibacter woesei DSM 14684]
MRRGIRAGAAIAVAALLAAGCGSGGGGELSVADLGSGPPRAGTVEPGALDGKKLTFVSYGGDSQRAQMEVLSGFEQESGAQLLEDSPPDYAKIKAQVESDNVTWDVVVVDGIWAAGQCGRLLEDLDPDVIDTSHLPRGVEATRCAMPGNLDGNVFAYDAQRFADDPPSSWADFFDTARYPGKRAVDASDPSVTLEIALLADGVRADDLYPIDVDRALRKLDTIRDDLVFWSSGAQQQQMMTSRQIAMGTMWSGRVYFALQAGAQFDVVHDQPLLTTTTWVVPRGARDPIGSMAMINWWLGARQGAQYTALTSYPSVNADARPVLDADARKVAVMDPPFTDQVVVSDEYWSRNIGRLTDVWIDWVNG